MGSPSSSIQLLRRPSQLGAAQERHEVGSIHLLGRGEIIPSSPYIKDASFNGGTHVLHFGGEYDSYLLVTSREKEGVGGAGSQGDCSEPGLCCPTSVGRGYRGAGRSLPRRYRVYDWQRGL